MISRSAFLKVTIAFVAFYLTYSAGFICYDMYRSYIADTARSIERVNHYMIVGRELLGKDDVDSLSFRLDDAIKDHRINYYLIKRGSERIVYSNAAGIDDPIDLETPENEEGMVLQNEARHFVIHQGDYTLVIGHKISIPVFIRTFFEDSKDLYIKDIVFVLLAMTAIVFYSFRDLLSIVTRIRQRGGGAQSYASIAKSREVLTLVQGIKGFQNAADSLAQENRILKNQVLPALQKELLSGRTPPYEFGCTLVRTDINNFSHIFASHDRTLFMKEVNDFFTGVAHIVSRYSGFVYEFIGDEVIYYFKDDQPNSAALAMTCVRDVNKLADEFSERTEREHGYAFRVKTALSAGTLRFGPLVNGYSLAGSPLTESVRMLSHVHDRSANTALMDDQVWERSSAVCSVAELGVFQLKGVRESRRLHVYQSHVPLVHHLRQQGTEQLKNSIFYRSDADIAEALDYIHGQYEALPQQDILALLAGFKKFRVTMVSAEIKHAYLNLLDKLSVVAATHEPKATYALSALIAATPHLFPKGGLTGRLRFNLTECLAIPQRRIVANTIDVFSELDPNADDLVFEKLLKDPDNRVSANALIKNAKREWKRSTLRRLKVFLSHESSVHKSSGLYALGEIASYFRTTDEVAYHADLELQKVIKASVQLYSHANPLIRRQSIMAGVKAGLRAELRGHLAQKDLAKEVRDDLTTLTGTETSDQFVGAGPVKKVA